MRRLAVALLVVCGCGPSAAEVAAQKARARELAETQEAIASSEWAAARAACAIIQLKQSTGLRKVTDEEAKSCAQSEVKRSAFVKACVTARADETACELKAQRNDGR